MLNKKWEEILQHLDYAFQPIVNIHSGKTFGVEALIRGVEKAGFPTIDSIFNQAYLEDVLYPFELELRQEAIRKFSQIPFCKEIRLFFNVDSRLSSILDYRPGNTIGYLKKRGLSESNFCVELSEKHEFDFPAASENMLLTIYKQQNYKIVIDDFGTGYSTLKLLYNAEPDFIKINRFFIAEIENNRKKKLFVANMIDIAQTLGISVIAEGVENEKEFFVCKEMGANLVQGYFVSKPTKNVENIQPQYEIVSKISSREKRGESLQREQILEKIMKIEPVCVSGDMHAVLETFRKNKDLNFIPAIDIAGEPLGLIREYSLKEYTYSPFGQALLKNQANSKNLKKFITKCGICDVNETIEKILKIYSCNKEESGLIITKDEKYAGFLSARVLLDLLAEQNVLNARNLSPLTGLPGNHMIAAFISEALIKKEYTVLVYFDFDNFKPFNDAYGFRIGDRVITLFADILKESNALFENCLIGHIGGDDFFIGYRSDDKLTFEDFVQLIQNIAVKFKNDVESFYHEKDRKRGYISSKNRDGKNRKFDLLTVSAAILELSNQKFEYGEESIGEILANLKKISKNSPTKIAAVSLL